MNSYFRAVSAEFVKLKWTGIFWLSTAGAVFTNIMISTLALYLPQITSIIPGEISTDTLSWIRFHYDGILPMLLPMYIVILCALSVRLELKAKGWKMLYAMPVTRSVIYGAKLTLVVFAFAFSHGIFWVLMSMAPSMFGMDMEISTVPFGFLMGLYIITLVSSLGILGMMFFVSYFSRGFVLPLAVGILGFVAAQLFADYSIHATYFPFSMPRIAVRAWLDQQEISGNVLLTSSGCFILFLLLGTFISKREYRY